jgi:hypothetical protein
MKITKILKLLLLLVTLNIKVNLVMTSVTINLWGLLGYSMCAIIYYRFKFPSIEPLAFAEYYMGFYVLMFLSLAGLAVVYTGYHDKK